MRPIAITANTNMNSLKTPGVYMCAAGSIADTLINCPVTYAFSMLVMKRGTTVTQLIFTIGDIFQRIEDSSQSTGWRPWYKHTGTAVS